MRRLFKSAVAGLISLFSIVSIGSVAQAQDEHDINLRLFGTNVVGSYDGCRLAFWQANKDPRRDKFAYVFYAPFNDGGELPAWIKVGKTVHELYRQDNMMANGQRLEDLRLYREESGGHSVLVEVMDQHVEGDSILVDKARLTITHRDFFPFVITVKGGIICPSVSPSASHDAAPSPVIGQLSGDPIQLSSGVEFSSVSAIPVGVMQTVQRDAPDCNPSETAGFGNRFAISDAMTLWEVPCNLYAKLGTSVFVTSLNENPEWSNVLLFPEFPEHGDSGYYEINNPAIQPSNAIVTSEHYDGDGTCGTYEAFQLRAVEGEALEFFLIESREKTTCDGRDGMARDFPLIYSAR